MFLHGGGGSGGKHSYLLIHDTNTAWALILNITCKIAVSMYFTCILELLFLRLFVFNLRWWARTANIDIFKFKWYLTFEQWFSELVSVVQVQFIALIVEL